MRILNGLTFVLISLSLLATPGWATAQPGRCVTKPKRIAQTLSGKDAKSVTITGAFMRSGPDAPAAWNISYVTPEGRPVLEVSIDGKSGAVRSKTPR